MHKKTMIALRLDPGLIDAMRVLKDRDGVPVTAQVERALRQWLHAKGVEPAPRRENRSHA